MKTLKELRWLLPVALIGASCSSILGIEDVHPDAKPGSDDDNGGETGSGGTNGGKGGVSGASGNAGKGGASGASGSPATGGSSSGDSGAGGAGDTGGTAGTGGAPDDTVRGRILTTWLQPIPNVAVMIGDAESITNSDGEFEIPDVAEEYDAKFIISYDVNTAARTYAWAYLGLTRRDPTLTVYNGLAFRSGNVTVQPSQVAQDTYKFLVATGGVDGMYSWEPSTNTGPTSTSSYWIGPATTVATGHALVFETNSDDLPTVYRSYDQTNVVLAENTPATMAFTLADETIASSTIGGTVSSPTSSERTNYVFLRFESKASLKLVEHSGTSLNPDSFGYVVPAITDSSIEVAAVEGDWYRGPSGIAHRDRVPPGSTAIALVIPAPPAQVAPAPDTYNVDDQTTFSWTSTAGTFVLELDNIEPTSPFGGMFVVTSEKRITIPTFTNGFTLLPGDLYNWRVETHGSATSVDELAGPEGFADTYAPTAYGPESPRRGDGTYAISAGRVFTTAP